MMSISRIQNNSKFPILTFALLAFVYLLLAKTVFAQSLSLSITPTIVEMTADPGQDWSGEIKVINNNDFPLQVYASVVNFSPQGESGRSIFLPVPDEGLQNATLAEWLSVPETAINIDAAKGKAIPIDLHVPKDAAPGGHYAAIQISTSPPKDANGAQVKTTQVVTSLFFVRIEGDVVESASIRSFRATDGLVASPAADFELRFENKGNVHLQPQGEIVIKNMWGAERGTIPINQQTLFGKVLPDMIRKYNFSWKGAFSFSNIGRYTAEIALSYGTTQKQFVSSKTSFWVIPLKQLILVLIALAGLIYFVRFMIRVYVRRMLILAGVDPDIGRSVPVSTPRIKGADLTVARRSSVQAPMLAAVKDFQKRVFSGSGLRAKFLGLVNYVLSYKIFFSCLILAIITVSIIFWYIGEARSEKLPYQVTYENLDQSVEVSSDEIIYNEDKQNSNTVIEDLDSNYELSIVNVSGVSGAAAAVRNKLEANGFMVSSLDTKLSRKQKNTSIVYSAELEVEALAISKILDGALLSRSEDAENSLIIYLGTDVVE